MKTGKANIKIEILILSVILFFINSNLVPIYSQPTEQLYALKRILSDQSLVKHYEKLEFKVKYYYSKTEEYSGNHYVKLYDTKISIFNSNQGIVSKTFKAHAPFGISIPISGPHRKSSEIYGVVDIDIICKALLETFTDEELESVISSTKFYVLKKMACIELDSDICQEFWVDIIKTNNHSEDHSEAVTNLDPNKWQNLLADIAENNQISFGAREEAIIKLDSDKWQNLLATIAKNNQISSRASREAIIKLDPAKWQNLLADLAKNDQTDYWVRLLVIKRLDLSKWYNLLTEISENNQESYNIREAASIQLRIHKSLLDGKTLGDIAKNNKSESVREAVIERLDPDKCQNLLADIVIHDDVERNRYTAFKKLYNQKALLLVVNNLEDEKIQKLAFSKITDKDALAIIAKNNFKSDIHKMALEKLDPDKWQDLFADIAINHSDYLFRNTAIKKLDPDKWQELLADIAKNAVYYNQKAAIEKLDTNKWQDLFANIAQNDNDASVREIAVEKLDPNRWQELLADIAKKDESYKTAYLAIDKLSEQKLIKQIAKKSKYWKNRRAAVYKLDDQKVLMNIAKKDKDTDVSKAAKERLKELIK